MPAFVIWIAGLLGPVLAHVLGRVVFMLGITTVTVTGVTAGLASLKADFLATFGGLPATMVQVLGLLRIDQAVLLIFSAMAARLALKVVGDAVSSIVAKAPPTGRL